MGWALFWSSSALFSWLAAARMGCHEGQLQALTRSPGSGARQIVCLGSGVAASAQEASQDWRSGFGIK